MLVRAFKDVFHRCPKLYVAATFLVALAPAVMNPACIAAAFKQSSRLSNWSTLPGTAWFKSSFGVKRSLAPTQRSITLTPGLAVQKSQTSLPKILSRSVLSNCPDSDTIRDETSPTDHMTQTMRMLDSNSVEGLPVIMFSSRYIAEYSVAGPFNREHPYINPICIRPTEPDSNLSPATTISSTNRFLTVSPCESPSSSLLHCVVARVVGQAVDTLYSSR